MTRVSAYIKLRLSIYAGLLGQLDRTVTAKNEITMGEKCAVQTNAYSRRKSEDRLRKVATAALNQTSTPEPKEKRKAAVTAPATTHSKKVKVEDGENSEQARSSMSSTQAPKFQIPTLSDSEEDGEEEEVSDQDVSAEVQRLRE